MPQAPVGFGRALNALDLHLGPAREVAWSSFPLERLKRIGHNAPESATVNDVVLAVVAGALRRWLPEAGGVAEDLRVQCPVCLHAREEEKESSATETRS
jgi:NRPS condensation-like uncharacterized protein